MKEVRRWPCPNCGELIPVIARQCRFCGQPPKFNPAIERGSFEEAVVLSRWQREVVHDRSDERILTRIIESARQLVTCLRPIYHAPSLEPSLVRDAAHAYSESSQALLRVGLPLDGTTPNTGDLGKLSSAYRGLVVRYWERLIALELRPDSFIRTANRIDDARRSGPKLIQIPEWEKAWNYKLFPALQVAVAQLETVGVVSLAAEQPAPVLARNRRGRKPETDSNEDRRIYDAWQTKSFRIYKELATLKGITRRQVETAIDRHRKRIKRHQASDK